MERYLVAVDPCAKSETFCGFSRNPLDFQKSLSLKIQPNSSPGQVQQGGTEQLDCFLGFKQQLLRLSLDKLLRQDLPAT